MNFLLHREWALRETGDPVLAAASMLPDLWRMVERRARLGSRHFRVAGSGEAGTSFSVAGSGEAGTSLNIEGAADSAARGLAHHLTTDRWFHDDALFTDGEQRAVRAMANAGVRSEKMILFAHPLWELCLDGALVRLLGWEHTQRGLAEARAAAGGAAGVAIAEATGLTRLLPEASARTAFSARLESLWDALQEGRWIAAYTTPHGLAECMVRMRQRVGFGDVDAADRARLETAIATLEAGADAAIAARLPAQK